MLSCSHATDGHYEYLITISTETSHSSGTTSLQCIVHRTCIDTAVTAVVLPPKQVYSKAVPSFSYMSILNVLYDMQASPQAAKGKGSEKSPSSVLPRAESPVAVVPRDQVCFSRLAVISTSLCAMIVTVLRWVGSIC